MTLISLMTQCKHRLLKTTRVMGTFLRKSKLMIEYKMDNDFTQFCANFCLTQGMQKRHRTIVSNLENCPKSMNDRKISPFRIISYLVSPSDFPADTNYPCGKAEIQYL